MNYPYIIHYHPLSSIIIHYHPLSSIIPWWAMAVLVRATEPVVKPAAAFVSAHWLHSGSGNSGCNTAVKCTRLGYPELSSNQRIQRMSRKRDRFSFPCDLFRSSKWPTHFFSLMLTSWRPWSPRISGGHPMWPSAGFISAKGWPGGQIEGVSQICEPPR